MKRVAVLGGGPSGSFAAEQLARGGMDVILLDEKLAWEKPCGGGLTYKAYREYPFLIRNDKPKTIIGESTIAAHGAGQVSMRLSQPLVIYSRYDLNQMLLDRAAAAGARIEQARVLGIERSNGGWRLRTRHGALEADSCVVATGARNSLPGVGTAWTARDTMFALGYYIPGGQARIDIQFLPGLEGYIWVFPRCDHLSVGICGKGESAAALRRRLETFMDERGMKWRGERFYAHVLPSLDARSWERNRIAGEGWLAAGDAAGLVDPITGEGIYYALRSGEIAARVLLSGKVAPESRAQAYRDMLRSDFTGDLQVGAGIARRVYIGRFLFNTVPVRMVQFVRSSPRFREVIQDLLAGTQPYGGLKGRLMRNLSGTLREVFLSFFLRKLIPNPNEL